MRLRSVATLAAICLARVTVLDEHIYTDQAQSGARRDRHGLASLLTAAQGRQFDIVLVDDLSRLARDNLFDALGPRGAPLRGRRVVSVADDLDSNDEEATLGIQISWNLQ